MLPQRYLKTKQGNVSQKKIIVWDFHKGGLELSAKKARKGLLREYYYFTFFLDPLPILVIYMFC